MAKLKAEGYYTLNIKVMEQIKIMEVTAIPHARTHTLTRVCICQKKKKHTNPCGYVELKTISNT